MIKYNFLGLYVVLFILCSSCQQIVVKPKVEEGILNVNKWDFHTYGSVPIEGETFFEWNKIIETSKYKYSSSHVIVPGDWSKFKVNGINVQSHGYGTYAFKVVIPKEYDGKLGLEISEVGSAYKLFIENDFLGEVGRLSKIPEQATPLFRNEIYKIPRYNKDTVLIRLQVSNYHTKNGGIWHAPSLGEYNSLLKAKNEEINIDFFLLGSLIIISLYHLSLFSYRVKDKSTLYFSLFCIIIAIRTVALSKLNLSDYWGGYGWEWREKLSYLTFSLGLLSFIIYMRDIFPKDYNKLIFKIKILVVGLFTLFVLFTPSKIFSHGLSFFQIFTLLSVLYGIVVIIKALLKKRESAKLFLTGFIVLAAGVINDILYANSIVNTGFSISFAMFFFIFLQALILSIRFSKSFKRVESLSTELNDINKNLERKVNERTKILQETSFALATKNKNITESINYASRIQEAILPTDNKLSKALKEYFVFYKPRDVVSGDFFWLNDIKNETDSIVLAVVDCTGHGVPGAFMSMLGSELLSQIVNEQNIKSANEILRQLHLKVRRALNQQETDNREGMDLSVVVIHKENKFIEFAGAKSPIVYIQNGELHQLKGNKTPIGGQQREKERFFSSHTISLKAPTTFYLFTDGFQDQFGGENGRKFNPKQLRELLLSIHKLPMSIQKEKIDQSLKDWMQNERQIDDILLMGVKV